MRHLVIIILLAIVCCANAQTIQQGIVKEYNEKSQKTPLDGVELNVRSANSTVSDNDGTFVLNFITAKPGDKINVRRIEKLGYEVFNKEAIEQWNLNPTTPFLIVMCRSDLFKKIRDNYEKVSSESYARQLQKEETALAKLKADGKLKEEEYQKQLFELRENYDKQLDNLDNYIDRFSRIDLSELTSVEQEIIDLVQQGKIEEAIAKYEAQNYVEKYKREVEDIKEVSRAIDQLSTVHERKIQSRDSILAAINRQIETLRIAGGKENFDKIYSILREITYSDTTNLDIHGKYANFLNQQNFIDEAIFEYERLINFYLSKENTSLGDYEKISVIYDCLGSLLDKLGDIEDARVYFEKSLSIKDSIFDENSMEQLLELNISRHNLGNWYAVHGDFGNAKKLLDIVIRSRKEIANNDSSRMSDYLNSLEVMGIAYCINGDIIQGKVIFEEIYNNRLNSYIVNPSEENLIGLIGVAQNLANCYTLEKQYTLAIEKFLEGLEYIELESQKNPGRFKFLAFQLNANLGYIFLQNNQDEQALDYYRNAISEAIELNIHNGILPLYQNIVLLLTKQKNYDEAESTIASAIDYCGEDSVLLACKCIVLYEEGNRNSSMQLYNDKLRDNKDALILFEQFGYSEIFN